MTEATTLCIITVWASWRPNESYHNMTKVIGVKSNYISAIILRPSARMVFVLHVYKNTTQNFLAALQSAQKSPQTAPRAAAISQ